jgi:hypothetical protein
MPSLIDHQGRPIASKPPREPQPTRDQIAARRYAEWLRRFEVGVVEEDGGEPRRQSSQEIAQIFGVSRQAVEKGIRKARRLRAEMADVADAPFETA